MVKSSDKASHLIFPLETMSKLDFSSFLFYDTFLVYLQFYCLLCCSVSCLGTRPLSLARCHRKIIKLSVKCSLHITLGVCPYVPPSLFHSLLLACLPVPLAIKIQIRQKAKTNKLKRQERREGGR